MEDLKQKRLAFLEDTIKHYNLNNRCVSPKTGKCVYHPVDDKSKGCAIGRHLTSELAKKLDSLEYTAISQSEPFNLLPKELKELEQTFLVDIQCLHDRTYNWDENGLSKLGEKEVKEIKEDYKLN
jgi:hypothetical protein